ncbi:MAG: hypothetical protein KA350_06765 [Arenimonas sp.]|nr:hypothetical protein [Arenimonas sp.]
MNVHIIKVLAGNEVKLRLRRLSTLVTLFAVVILSWLMVPAKDSGMTLIALNDARVLNTSTALAFGTASLAAIVLGLGSFYLTRGRVSEDMRSGVGGVIAASQISNSLFLLSRWIGGVAYMISLIGALLGTTLVLHLIRGDGPIEISIYLQTYSMLLIPMVFFGVSSAILFDSFSFLMGKAGDVLFFILWMFQLALMAVVDGKGIQDISLLLLFDFSGLAANMMTLQNLVHSTQLSVGMSDYNAKLPEITLPHLTWPIEIIFLRMGSALMAITPLLLALNMFHRYSPDRVKVISTRKRRSPIAIINGWLRPLSRLVRPIFTLAGKLPGISGQILADVALTLVSSPLAIAMALFFSFAAMLIDASKLPVLLMAAVIFWGIFMSEISTRDYAASAEDITGTVNGGETKRYLRQLIASQVLGLAFMGVIALRWCLDTPMRAAAMLIGLFSLSALAMLFGRFSRTASTFIVLFLFLSYIALNAKNIAILDFVGFNGAANSYSMLMYALLGLIATIAGYGYNKQQAR